MDRCIHCDPLVDWSNGPTPMCPRHQAEATEAMATWQLKPELYGMVVGHEVMCGNCDEPHPWVQVVTHN